LPTHKPYTFAIATDYAKPEIAKEYVLPTLKIEREKEKKGITKCISNKGVRDELKVMSLE